MPLKGSFAIIRIELTSSVILASLIWLRSLICLILRMFAKSEVVSPFALPFRNNYWLINLTKLALGVTFKSNLGIKGGNFSFIS